jgi:hypothetical protein
VLQLAIDVAATTLPAGLEDGLEFDLSNVTAEAIRDQDDYSGIRVRMLARLVSEREPFHVDVSVGDPIWPAPAEICLERCKSSQTTGTSNSRASTTRSTATPRLVSQGGRHGAASYCSPTSSRRASGRSWNRCRPSPTRSSPAPLWTPQAGTLPEAAGSLRARRPRRPRRAQRSRSCCSSSSWWMRSRQTAMQIISASFSPGATSTP